MGDSLTFGDLLGARDIIFPPVYYATEESVERGKILYAKATSHTSEFIIFHPDELETVKQSCSPRRLVHLRDYPAHKLDTDLEFIKTLLDNYR